MAAGAEVKEGEQTEVEPRVIPFCNTCNTPILKQYVDRPTAEAQLADHIHRAHHDKGEGSFHPRPPDLVVTKTTLRQAAEATKQIAALPAAQQQQTAEALLNHPHFDNERFNLILLALLNRYQETECGLRTQHARDQMQIMGLESIIAAEGLTADEMNYSGDGDEQRDSFISLPFDRRIQLMTAAALATILSAPSKPQGSKFFDVHSLSEVKNLTPPSEPAAVTELPIQPPPPRRTLP